LASIDIEGQEMRRYCADWPEMTKFPIDFEWRVALQCVLANPAVVSIFVLWQVRQQLVVSKATIGVFLK
jgi:hypothetical protein